MKKLLAFLLFPVLAFGTTTVTGNIQNLGTGTIGSGAFVRFWLRGCAGNQPRINGTAIIAPSQGGVFFFDFPANASGAISGTLYSTRDSTGLLGGDIECGGSTTAVWYGMVAFYAGKGGPEVPVHAKNTATLNVSNVTPITTNPVITSPTGDSTYARLDAGNLPFTGNVQAPTFQIGSSGPQLSKSTDSCCTGFAETSTGLETQSTLAVQNGSVIAYQNDAYFALFDNSFEMFIQAGPRSGGGFNVLHATSTFTLPDLANGGSSNTAGALLGETASDIATSSGDCLFSSGSSQGGLMKDSGIACNSSINFKSGATQFLDWTTGSFAGSLGIPGGGVSGNRTWTLPDATGNVGLNLNATNGIYQSKRGVSGCTTGGAAGNSCGTDITVTWGTAFADANYSVTCTGNAPTNVPSGPFVTSGTKLSGSVHINYFAITAAAASYATIDCIAVHD